MGCDRSTNEIRDLLFQLFGPRNDALTARSDGQDLQLSTPRALLRLTAELSTNGGDHDESVEARTQPDSPLPAMDPVDFEQFVSNPAALSDDHDVRHVHRYRLQRSG